jgi:hypothetical protein
VARRRQEIVQWTNSPSTEKNIYYEKKRRKNGTDQHDENQQQMEEGLTFDLLECTINVQTRRLRITINELRKYKIPGRPSCDTHDQIRKITLKTTTAQQQQKQQPLIEKSLVCLREKTMIDYVIYTVIPKVIIT